MLVRSIIDQILGAGNVVRNRQGYMRDTGRYGIHSGASLLVVKYILRSILFRGDSSHVVPLL
jgi:hypothetical protein